MLPVGACFTPNRRSEIGALLRVYSDVFPENHYDRTAV